MFNMCYVKQYSASFKIGWIFSGIYLGNILLYIKLCIIFLLYIVSKKIVVGREKGRA